ncbi:tetratricopeptide repeat protein [Mucilaginibacter antarcticus]|uniref:Tetratricopeptide repeat protein n=1 Tax=Mucilaginibacter antarcticus TaxID=1855725 RepID=A0ABW5XKS2_9SPHI
MNKKQITLIVATLAVVGYLYSLPVKGLIKASEPHDKAASSAPVAGKAALNVNAATVSEPARAAIGEGLAATIIKLEEELANASSDADKVSIQKKLAKQWEDVNQPAPAAFYYQAVARKDNSFDAWLSAGNRFNDAVKLEQDTAIAPAFVTGAVEAFKGALKLKPENLEAKTGLGVAYANGGASSPMQGITLLREVIAKDPKNLSANLNLGLLSMKSGQYDKAVDRFKTVISVKPSIESYFYLAETYKQLGRKTEAVAAYEKCKDLIPDPVFGKRIDQYIKELKN